MAARLLDELRPGEQQSEADHNLLAENTGSGSGTGGRKQRHVIGGRFSFEMKVLPHVLVELACRYRGGDGGNCIFDILVDGERVASEALKNEKAGQHIRKTYAIPAG